MRLNNSVEVPEIKFRRRESSSKYFEDMPKKSSRRKTLLTPEKNKIEFQKAEQIEEEENSNTISISVNRVDLEAIKFISILLDTHKIRAYQRKLMILTKDN